MATVHSPASLKLARGKVGPLSFKRGIPDCLFLFIDRILTRSKAQAHQTATANSHLPIFCYSFPNTITLTSTYCLFLPFSIMSFLERFTALGVSSKFSRFASKVKAFVSNSQAWQEPGFTVSKTLCADSTMHLHSSSASSSHISSNINMCILRRT